MIRLHKISGKERGLMVIGSASELRALASDLLAATNGKPEKTSEDHPVMLSEFLPVKDLDQGLSFHLETEKGDLPKTVFGDTETGTVIWFLLAIVGLVAIIRFALLQAL